MPLSLQGVGGAVETAAEGAGVRGAGEMAEEGADLTAWEQQWETQSARMWERWWGRT